MRARLAVLVLLVGLVAPTLQADAASARVGAVSFTGENGTLAGGSGVAAVVNNSASKRGIRGLQLSSNASRSYVSWGVPSGHSYAAVRLWVRVTRRRAGESVDVFTLQNTQGARHFDLFVNGRNQRLMWDLFRDDADSTSFALSYNRWYLVEALIEFGGSTHTARVRIDGVDQGTISSSGSNSNVRAFIVGSASKKTHTQHYDDVVVRVGDAPMNWAPAPA